MPGTISSGGVQVSRYRIPLTPLDNSFRVHDIHGHDMFSTISDIPIYMGNKTCVLSQPCAIGTMYVFIHQLDVMGRYKNKQTSSSVLPSFSHDTFDSYSILMLNMLDKHLSQYSFCNGITRSISNNI